MTGAGNKLVLVRPGHGAGLQDRLFATDSVMGDFGHFNTPFSYWRQRCAAEGIALHTWDMAPLHRADVFWILDLPPTRAELQRLRREHPRTPIVLQVHESPVDRLHYFDARNHAECDRVLTYDPSRRADGKYVPYHLPASDFGSGRPSKSFAARRPIAMLQTNRYAGWMAPRGPGRAGLPVVGPLLGGWHLHPSRLLATERAENYSRRRRLARAAERACPEDFDLFGANWAGEPASWLHRFRRPKPFACLRARRVGAKYELLSGYRFVIAFENYTGNLGYISEKLFDGLYGDCVPIYLGDTDIEHYVPADAFVDGRKFRSPEELLDYCRQCPEAEWEAMYRAGQAFRRSPAIKPFQEEAFAETALGVLRSVLPPRT